MSYAIFSILFISFVTIIYLFMKKKRKYSKLPPGPKKLPIIGNLHQLGKFPHKSLHELSQVYGDFMFLQLGSVPTLVVSSADMAREIFKTHDLAVSGRPPLYVAQRLTYNLSSISFAPYGEYWREARKIAVLELLTIKRVESFSKVRDQELDYMIDSVIQMKNLIDLSATAFSVINNVIRRVAFGMDGDLDHGERDETGARFQEIFLETQHLFGEFNIADYFPSMAWINRFNGVDKRIRKNLEDLDMIFDKVMEEHLDSNRATSDYEDIIDVLLQIKEDSNQAIILKNEHIKGVLIDVFVAASDTSTATIIWTMTELMRNPKVREKALRELRIICKGKIKVEENDLDKLPYLKLIVKESLRLHPPAPLMIPRETIQDCTIASNYEIPAKTRVIFNAASIGMDPKYWESPKKFWPERFLGRDIDFRGQHFEFLPFGAGRRGCPGISFAISIVELVLANLLFRFDWELPEGMLEENIDMEEALGITMHKKVPLCLVASPANI